MREKKNLLTVIDWLKSPLGRLQELREKKARERLNELKWRYHVFRSLLHANTRAVEFITDIDLKLRETDTFWPGLKKEVSDLVDVCSDLVEKLNQLSGDEYQNLFGILSKISGEIESLLKGLKLKEEDIPICVGINEILPTYASYAGSKAVALANLRAKGIANVPNGFSLLVGGCRYFLEQGGLSLRILKKLQPLIYTGKEVNLELEREIEEMIMATPVPRRLEVALEDASRGFFDAQKGLAVRSSALGEDSIHHSFAGQFATVLNVTSFKHLKDAVRKVIASNFSARSLSYRLASGLRPLDFNMAVLCIEMVDAEKAGVLFTVDPNALDEKSMLITAVYGMGELVVSGATAADVYKPFRDRLTSVSLREEPRIAKKSRRLCLNPEGGLMEEDVPLDIQDSPVLSMDEIRQLVSFGLRVEEIQGCPQDIEWAVDRDGKIWILQARPLILDKRRLNREKFKVGDHRAIVEGGIVASRGKATGVVKKVRNRQDLDFISKEPTILVLHRSVVDAAKIIGHVEGVLVDYGNPADHLSCVAREQGRPMLVGLVNAMEKLRDRQWVTVDSYQGKVLEADKTEIEASVRRFSEGKKVLAPSNKGQEESRGTVNDQRLQRLQELTVKLNLTDAYGPTFSIMECRSLHDIVRYVHEMAVMEIFDAGDEVLEGASGIVYTLKSDVPFFLKIIDLGGGLMPSNKRRRSVTVDEIRCRPFKALWKGISTPGLRWASPPPIVSDVSSVMGRWMSDARSKRPIGLPNYVMIARDYMNLNARMDFHFTMVDAVCGMNHRENYVKFRFKGGGTGMKHRHRRAVAIGEILERAGFFADVKGDLVNAVYDSAPAEIIEEKLVITGRLLGFTRLIDAAMRDDETPHLVANAFWEGDYELSKLVETWSREEKK